MLAIRHLSKTYRADRSVVPAVNDVSLDVPRGSFFTLLGPSGCGKTTILQCIAGLETPDRGEIEIDGAPVYSSMRNVDEPPNRRRLGMVFQSYAVWPHMTVFENVAFPLRQSRPRLSRQEIGTRTKAALASVRLDGVADKLAPFLSGGQQQRVALARALVHEPRLLLLDEPLSNLDAKLREEMRTEIGRLVRDLGITAVFVTHDQIEALTMSDCIALMDGGRVVQQGAPHDIYYRPQSAFAARFVGNGNIIPGQVALGPDAQGNAEIVTPFGRVGCRVPTGIAQGSKIDVIVRPDAMRVCNGEAPTEETLNFFRIQISQASFIGDFIEAVAHAGPATLRVRLGPHAAIQPPHAAVIEVIADRCVVLLRRD
jgi:iron(III) transport system ATP-binding protein